MNKNIKIYHIVHINNLSSIIADGYLFSDAEMRKRQKSGVVIGMDKVKERRLSLPLASHPGLPVGNCVPFYFCPRSVMLYVIYKGNSPDVAYRDGQAPIIHLVSDLNKTIEWAEQNDLRWAFTTSTAGAYYFEDYTDLKDLGKIDWQAVQATQWDNRDVREKKQAEFLVEHRFPWELVDEIGVCSYIQYEQVHNIIGFQKENLLIKIQKEWYY